MKYSLPSSGLLLQLVFLLGTALRTLALDVSPPLITPGVSVRDFELKNRVATSCNNEICASGYTCTGPVNGLAKCCTSGSSCAVISICTPSSVIASLNSGMQTLSGNTNAIYCTDSSNPYCNTYIYLAYNSVSLIGCDSEIALGSKVTITDSFTASSPSSTSTFTITPTSTTPSSTITTTVPASSSTSTSSLTSSSATSTPAAGLPTGAIAGIAVGAVLVGLAIIGAAVFLIISNRKKDTPAPTPAPEASQQYQQSYQQPQSPSQNAYNSYGNPVSPVAPGSPPPQWSPGADQAQQGWGAPAPAPGPFVSEIGPGKD